MQLAKLISPISIHLKNKTSQHSDPDDTDATEDRHEPIYTPNSIHYHERSYFKDSVAEVEPTLSQEKNQDAGNKLVKMEMIDSELEHIEKMKSQFQRKKKVDSQSSIERIANRSIERHHLKPSGAPKISHNTTEFSLTDDLKPQEPSFRQDDPQTDSPEVIIVDPQALFEHEDMSMQPLETSSMRRCSEDIERKNVKDCECEQVFAHFMKEARAKIEELSSKIAEIEMGNSKFRQSAKSQDYPENILKNIQTIQNVTNEIKFGSNPPQKEDKNTNCSFILKKNKGSKEVSEKKSAQPPLLKSKENRSSVKRQCSNPKIQTLLHRLQLRIEKS